MPVGISSLGAARIAVLVFSTAVLAVASVGTALPGLLQTIYCAPGCWLLGCESNYSGNYIYYGCVGGCGCDSSGYIRCCDGGNASDFSASCNGNGWGCSWINSDYPGQFFTASGSICSSDTGYCGGGNNCVPNGQACEFDDDCCSGSCQSDGYCGDVS